MYQTNSNKRSLRSALLLGAASAAAIGFSAQALAQDQTTETVIVTGSRIPQQGLYSASPVTSVGQEEMKFEGTNGLDSLLNNLPSVQADLNTQSSAFNGALGAANVDLRGLGSSRTLVLVNGKRLAPGDPVSPEADINVIPAALVDHVEVLTGGASAVYGSDAVAGVVNFIMRRDFQGIELDGNYSVNEAPNNGISSGCPQGNATAGVCNVPPSTLAGLAAVGGTPPAPSGWWGGRSGNATLIVGANTGDGKGNVTAYLGFREVERVDGHSRDFSNCALATGSSSKNSISCGGSSNYDRFNSFDSGSKTSYFMNGTGALGSGTLSPYIGGPTETFNYGAPADIQMPLTQYTGGFNGHYDVNKQLEVYADLMFADDDSPVFESPSALFQGAGPANFPGTTTPGYVEINCANPLMTPQENQILCGPAVGGTPVTVATSASNPFTHGAPFTYYGGQVNLSPGNATLTIGRRSADLGDRILDVRHTTYRMVVGAKGDLGDGWTYELFAQYGRSVFEFHWENDLSVSRTSLALNVDPVTGACVAKEEGIAPNCSPLDIFDGFGGYNNTPQGLAYASADGFRTGYTEEQVAGGNITGNTARWGIQSPWAKDPIGFNFGTEYRAEYLEDFADSELANADLYGNAPNKDTPVPRSGFNVVEGYGEVKVPVIQDHFLAEDLELTGGYRYSSYSSVGHVTTYKYGAEWQPIDDIRFRAGYNRATRAPNVLELFTPAGIGLIALQDPCETSTAGQCATVPNAGTGKNGALQCPASQCYQQTSGNPSLKPEVTDTRTVGVVFTPTFLDGFTATVDYYDISISDYISSYGTSTILAGCYGATATAASIALYCPLVHRSPISGAIFGGGYVSNLDHNLPFIKTKGVDMEVNYSSDLDRFGLDGLGSMHVNIIGTYVGDWEQSSSPVLDGQFYDCAGKFGPTCLNVYPRWREKMRVTWNTPWDVDLSFQWRFIGAVKLDSDSTDPLLGGVNPTVCTSGVVVNGAGNCIDHEIRNYDYFDLAGVWHVTEGVELRAGVNNIFAVEPPVLGATDTPIPFGAANTYPGTYDMLGRYLFVGGTIKY